MLEINTDKGRVPLMDTSIDWTLLRKVSVSLIIGQ